MGSFLPEKELPGLKKYRYSSIDRSLVSQYILKPFYQRFVNVFPLWLAPNLITLSGLLFTGTGALMTLYYNQDFNSVSPSWLYFVYGLQLFFYQTFDACDGLQARRTGSSSPLGELFDHTVDAINTTIGVIIFSATANFSPWAVIYSEFACTLNFMLSTWEEFHTGTLYLSYFSGPVEGVLVLVVAEFLTAIYGPQIWEYKIFWSFKTKDLQLVMLSIGILFNIAEALQNAQKASDKAEKSDKDEGHRRELQIHGLYPFITLWIGTVLWLLVCPELIKDQLWPVMLSTGLGVAFQVGRVILAHVTAQEQLPRKDIQSILPWVFLVCHFVVPPVFGKTAASVDKACIWLALGLNLGIYGVFVNEIIKGITGYLGIKCLSIKAKKA